MIRTTATHLDQIKTNRPGSRWARIQTLFKPQQIDSKNRKPCACGAKEILKSKPTRNNVGKPCKSGGNRTALESAECYETLTPNQQNV